MPISAAKRRNPSRDAQMFGGPYVHLGGASDAGSRRDAALRADFSSRQAYIADLVARDRALRNGDGSGSARGSTGVLPAYGDAYRPARRRDAWEQQSRSHSTLASLGLLAAERGASSAAQTTHPSSSARVGRPPAAAAAAAPAAAEAAAAAAAAPRPGAKVLHFGTPPPTRSESVARVRQQQAAAVAATDQQQQQQQQHAPRPRGSSAVNRDVREAAREAVRQRQAGDGSAWPTGKYRRDMASDGAARVMGLTAAAGVASSSSSSAAAEQSPARVAYLKGQRRPAERDAAGLPPTPREYSKRVFRDRSPSPFAPPEKRAQPAGGALSRRSTSVDAIGCESHDRERAHGLRPLPRPSNNHIAHVGRAPSPLRRGPSRSGTPSKTFNPILGC